MREITLNSEHLRENGQDLHLFSLLYCKQLEDWKLGTNSTELSNYCVSGTIIDIAMQQHSVSFKPHKATVCEIKNNSMR
jgi:hypothetical protein